MKQRDEHNEQAEVRAEITPVGDRSGSLALQRTADLWANATTDPNSVFRQQMLRDKTQALLTFAAFVQKPLGAITPDDVLSWQRSLEAQGLAPETVYGRISRVSSFYEWALKEPLLAQQIGANPVKLARPKAPKPYQSESVKALSDAEIDRLLGAIRARFDDPNQVDRVVARRDYALFLFYVLSGRRRTEIIRLRWVDIELRADGSLVMQAKVKGGTYLQQEIADPSVQAALLDYLQYSGRRESMKKITPLWVAHDRAQHTPPGKTKHNLSKDKVARQPGKQLSSHGFVKQLKGYAEAAGLEHIHLHQTRHTYARIVSEDSGSIGEVQDALGHKNPGTTRVYVPRVAVKKDKHSRAIATRFALDRQLLDHAEVQDEGKQSSK